MRLLQLAFVAALASGIGALLVYIVGVSNFGNQHASLVRFSLHSKFDRFAILCENLCAGGAPLSSDDLEALNSLQSHFGKCVVGVFAILFISEVNKFVYSLFCLIL